MSTIQYWKFDACDNRDDSIYINASKLTLSTMISAAKSKNRKLPIFKVQQRSDKYAFVLNEQHLKQGNLYVNHFGSNSSGWFLFSPYTKNEESDITILDGGPSSYIALDNCTPEEGYILNISSCRYSNDLREEGCQEKIKKVYLGDSNLISLFPGKTAQQAANESVSSGGKYPSFRFSDGREGECFVVHSFVGASTDSPTALQPIHEYTNLSDKTLVSVGLVSVPSNSSDCVSNPCIDYPSEHCYKPTPTPDIRKSSFWYYEEIYVWNCPSIYGSPVRDELTDGWIFKGKSPAIKVDYEKHLNSDKDSEWYKNEGYFSNDWALGLPDPFSGQGIYYEAEKFEDTDVVEKVQDYLDNLGNGQSSLDGLVSYMSHKKSRIKPSIYNAYIKVRKFYIGHSEEDPSVSENSSEVSSKKNLNQEEYNNYTGSIRNLDKKPIVPDADPVNFLPCLNDGKTYTNPYGSTASVGEGQSITVPNNPT